MRSENENFIKKETEKLNKEIDKNSNPFYGLAIREKIKHKKAKKQAIIREIHDLKAIGLNNKQIAEELGCHRCTISRYIKWVLEEDNQWVKTEYTKIVTV